ncbi:MAG: hypothetical protein GXP49_07265 [Deltaproteobacteria bacterium]|nr:hypothetical protein [Deltaproteobacteria bacterium]
MKKTMVFPVLAFFFLSCGTGRTGYDQAKLSAFRKALPQQTLISVKVPEATDQPVPLAVGDPATYPRDVMPTSQEINSVIKALLDQLDLITDTPPTFYDSEKMEFVWGPFDDSDSALQGDNVYLWVKDNGENTSEDFRYSYALVRGMGRDIAKNTPVIWGAANPDPNNDDFGNGVILWDFEANYGFEEANDPGHGNLDRGRFACAYFKGQDKDNQDNIITLVVGAFRNFVSKDDGDTATPLDADYFWGHVKTPKEYFDFIDFKLAMDLDQIKDSKIENLDIRMAFYNSGVGRAEMLAYGGDIPDESRVESTECWNSLIMREFFNIELVSQDGSRTEIQPTEGLPENCAMQNLDTVPSLDDVPADIMNALSDVAENGVPQ